MVSLRSYATNKEDFEALLSAISERSKHANVQSIKGVVIVFTAVMIALETSSKYVNHATLSPWGALLLPSFVFPPYKLFVYLPSPLMRPPPPPLSSIATSLPCVRTHIPPPSPFCFIVPSGIWS